MREKERGAQVAGAAIIAQARTMMDLSVAQLETRTGISPERLERFEKDGVGLSLSELIDLAHVVGVCMDHAVGREISTRRNLIALLSPVTFRCTHPAYGGLGWPRAEVVVDHPTPGNARTSGIYSLNTEIKSV